MHVGESERLRVVFFLKLRTGPAHHADICFIVEKKCVEKVRALGTSNYR